MVLPDELVDPVIDAAGGAQFYVDAINQLTMADFIASGQYDRHIRRMRAPTGDAATPSSTRSQGLTSGSAAWRRV
jgi:DNA-binding transcriptional MocR family regulator